MKGLIFVGMLPPNSPNPEERRFVEELATYLPSVHYLPGIGVKRLRLAHALSLIARFGVRGRCSIGGTVRRGSLLIIPSRSAWARAVNSRWLRQQLLRRTANRPQDWIIWIRFPSPELVEAISQLAFARVVYEPIDCYSAAEDLSIDEQQRVSQAEDRLTRWVTVVTGGLGLAERFRGAPGGSHWLPFGTDLLARRAGVGVTSIVGRPRLCVVGELDWRVDEALLCDLAAKHPDWQLVLVGPRQRPWGGRLARFANVHWLGRVPSERVRDVIRDCDVTLVPYRLTDWTRACLPVKVFEYLAEGKPVVATPLPELSLFKDVISIVPPDEFEAAIAQGMSQSNQKAYDHRRRASTRFTLQGRARATARLLQGEIDLAPTA